MKRIKLHKGSIVFINSLNSTNDHFGSNREMNSLIGYYIEVKGLSDQYRQAIKITHPSSNETYIIHCNDVSFEPILKNPRKIIKVERAIKGKFDVNTLSV